jgi:hypothetical protein
MRYTITLERSLTREYEIEADTLGEAIDRADAILAETRECPAEMDGNGEFWSYELMDESEMGVVFSR